MGVQVITKRQRKSEGRTSTVWVFWCPGCGCCHSLDDRWTVTGAPDRPTASPSLRTATDVDFENDRPIWGCHLFIRDGQLQFLSDCSHQLAGKTVPMVPVDRFGFRAGEDA